MIQYIGVFILLIPCGISDLRTRLVPVWFVGIFAVLAAVYHLLFSSDFLLQAAAGTAAGLLFVLISRLTGGALGMGDALVITALGLWCGFRDSVSLILFAFILAGIFGGVWMLVRKKKCHDDLPFVPFLLFSAAVSCIFSAAQGALAV